MWIILHCVYITHFVYPFIHRWTFGLFHLLAIVDNAAMNTCKQIFVRVPFLILLDIYPEMESLYHMVILHIIF